MLTLGRTTRWVAPATVVGNPDVFFSRVHTDSRTLAAGDLFIALKGERFDANDFLADAGKHGAVAAIAHHGLSAAGLPGLEVGDSKLALGQLAGGWRSQFDIPLIAVTGSNGKTTVTQMTASILRSWKQHRSLSTEGNFNNDVGLPLTLLRLTADHEAAVVELGMNRPGEIAYLADLAKPSVAVVNNAQREHLEFMVNVEAVARENGSVIDSLGPAGVAIFPAGDEFSRMWKKRAGSREVLTFALSEEGVAADILGQAQRAGSGWQIEATTPLGPIGFALQIAGRHNAKTALAAVAAAIAAGVPLKHIAEGLAAFSPVKGRSRTALLSIKGRPLYLVDDSYNANPDSMRAAIDVLADLPGPRLLVMGDMGEVGDQGPQFHREAGSLASDRGIHELFGIGRDTALAVESFGGGRHFENVESLNAAVFERLQEFGSLLVKGSRFMKMERVVQAVETYAAQLNEAKSHVA